MLLCSVFTLLSTAEKVSINVNKSEVFSGLSFHDQTALCLQTHCTGFAPLLKLGTSYCNPNSGVQVSVHDHVHYNPKICFRLKILYIF